MPPVTKSNPLAWASLALGVAATLLFVVKFQAGFDNYARMLNLFGGWLSLAALLLGFKALQGARKAASRCVRRPAAWGIFLGLLHLLLILVLFDAKPHRISKRNACVNNLHQLDGAKEQWALEFKKTASDRPTWNDLTGTDKYIKSKLGCPAKGVYTINDVGHKPLCSITDHTLM